MDKSIYNSIINRLNNNVNDGSIDVIKLNTWLSENNISDVISREDILNEDDFFNFIINKTAPTDKEIDDKNDSDDSDDSKEEKESNNISDSKLTERFSKDVIDEKDWYVKPLNDVFYKFGLYLDDNLVKGLESDDSDEINKAKEYVIDRLSGLSDDEINSKNDLKTDGLDNFRKMAKESDTLEDFIEKIRNEKDVSYEVSTIFFNKYGDSGNLTPEQAAENLYNEVNSDSINESLNRINPKAKFYSDKSDELLIEFELFDNNKFVYFIYNGDNSEYDLDLMSQIGLESQDEVDYEIGLSIINRLSDITNICSEIDDDIFSLINDDDNLNIHENMKHLRKLMELKENANVLFNKYHLKDINKIKESLSLEKYNEDDLNIIFEDVFKSLNIEIENDYKNNLYKLNESLKDDIYKKLL